jgi:hypothetical protein
LRLPAYTDEARRADESISPPAGVFTIHRLLVEEVAMRVQFEATLDDMVDAALRALTRSPSFSPYRWADNVGGAIFTGLLSGAVVYWLIPEVREDRLVVSIVAGIAGLVLFPILRMWITKRRLRRYYRELLGSSSPFSVQVESSPKGICVKQKTGQVIYEWRLIDSIRETADSIDIYPRHGGIVVVRKRGFESAEQMQRFVEEGEGYLARTRQFEESQ